MDVKCAWMLTEITYRKSQYGSMVGINADVYGFGVHALRATAATNALAHNTDIAKPEFEDRRYTPKERL
jgi:hypothetical protein